MTDLTAKAPYNPEKVHELHDQAKIDPPGPVTRNFLQRHTGILAGALMTFVFVALAFQARAGWENHREWVVAVFLPFFAIFGISFGNLIQRRETTFLSIGLIILLICALVTAGNMWRGYETTGDDGFRDFLSITQGILLTLAGLTFLIGLVKLEWQKPIKPPAPEM